MKIGAWGILLVYFCIFISCSKDDFLEEPFLPSVLRSSFIDVSNLHLAFPSIASNADRSKIVVSYREGTDHVSFDGKIIQMESFDKGKTWLNRKVIYQPSNNGDARDPQFLVLSNNDILCRFFERTSNECSTVKCLISSDFGTSYARLTELPFPTREEVFAAARGNMVVVDGVIYAVCYNRWSYTWLVKSEDNGKNWKNVAWVDLSLGTTHSDFSRINESSLGYANGKLYLVARQQSEDAFLQIGISEDLGLSWTWNLFPVKGEAPSLTPYKDSFILTYRNVDTKAKKYHFDIALMKDGKLVSSPITLFKSDSFDVGYGDVLTLSNSFLVCCYLPNKICCYEIKYDIFD